MIKIGITGGIGSGKSVICRIFSVLGIPVYDADREAKNLANTDSNIREQLISVAGPDVYSADGLNRPYLSELIFNDSQMLDKVNRIIHPRVAVHYLNWTRQHENYPYTIHESALIFESGLEGVFDKIIVVSAPENLRMRRVLSRSNMTMDKFHRIIQSQLPENEISGKADYVIVNDEKSLLLPDVLKLHELFMNTK